MHPLLDFCMDFTRFLYDMTLLFLKDNWSSAKLLKGSQERLLNLTIQSNMYEKSLIIFLPLSEQNVALAGDFKIGTIL